MPCFRGRSNIWFEYFFWTRSGRSEVRLPTPHKGRRHKKKQYISYGPVRKPPGRNQNRYFIWKREKMQNVLKWRNMEKYFVTFLQGYPLKTWTFIPIFSYIIFPLEPKYFLKYVYRKIKKKKIKKNISKVRQKKVFASRGGGGSERYNPPRHF